MADFISSGIYFNGHHCKTHINIIPLVVQRPSAIPDDICQTPRSCSRSRIANEEQTQQSKVKVRTDQGDGCEGEEGDYL